jgi:hypothetical protein
MFVLFCADTPKSKTYMRKMAAAAALSEGDSLRSPTFGRPENGFKEFLWQHVDMAFNKGFDDNVGRNAVAARFEVGEVRVHKYCKSRLLSRLFLTLIILYRPSPFVSNNPRPRITARLWVCLVIEQHRFSHKGHKGNKSTETDYCKMFSLSCEIFKHCCLDVLMIYLLLLVFNTVVLMF